MPAGARNWAADARLMYFSAASESGRDGAMIDGRLKDAKTVMQSLTAKSAYVTPGTGREETVPNRRVNCESLYRHRERFAALVATNLAGPLEVLEAGASETVDL